MCKDKDKSFVYLEFKDYLQIINCLGIKKDTIRFEKVSCKDNGRYDNICFQGIGLSISILIINLSQSYYLDLKTRVLVPDVLYLFYIRIKEKYKGV